jgi:hypothetical protein
MTYYVNLYTSGQAYGGPEEGGWWYTYLSHEKTLASFRTSDEAEDFAGHVNRETNSSCNMGYIPGGSRGEENYKVLVERHRGKSLPTEVPHYE